MNKLINILIILMLLVIHYKSGDMQLIRDVRLYTVSVKELTAYQRSNNEAIVLDRRLISWWDERRIR